MDDQKDITIRRLDNILQVLASDGARSVGYLQENIAQIGVIKNIRHLIVGAGHEDISELENFKAIQKLINDGYAQTVPTDIEIFRSSPNLIIHITSNGLIFYEDGGYSKDREIKIADRKLKTYFHRWMPISAKAAAIVGLLHLIWSICEKFG